MLHNKILFVKIYIYDILLTIHLVYSASFYIGIMHQQSQLLGTLQAISFVKFLRIFEKNQRPTLAFYRLPTYRREFLVYKLYKLHVTWHIRIVWNGLSFIFEGIIPNGSQ